MTETLTVGDAEAVRLEERDLPGLLRLCLSCTAFYELIEGQPATETTAAEILGPLDSEYAHGVKHVWGVRRGGQLIAVAELLQGHPDVRDWYFGLLLIDPDQRRKGLGTQFSAAILNWIGDLGGSTVRLVVQQQNADARSFWERQGFAIEREVVKQSGRRVGPVWILVRRIGEAA